MTNLNSFILAQKHKDAAEFIKEQFPECVNLERYAKTLTILHALEDPNILNDKSVEFNDEVDNLLRKFRDKTLEFNDTENNKIDALFRIASKELDKNVFFTKIFKFAITTALLVCITYTLITFFREKHTKVWEAKYYTNSYLDGIPLRTETEKAPFYSWQASSPYPEIPADNFSVSWQSTLKLDDEIELSIDVNVDDGIRIYIDSEIVLESWRIQHGYIQNVTRKLSAGLHNIRIEYFEAGGGATIKTSFKGFKPGTREEIPLQFVRPN